MGYFNSQAQPPVIVYSGQAQPYSEGMSSDATNTENKSDYLPWILGGVAVIAIGAIGVSFYRAYKGMPEPGVVWAQEPYPLTQMERIAQNYANRVANEMLKLRGFSNPKEAPREQVNYVFNLMSKYKDVVDRGLRGHVNEYYIAKEIQNKIWGLSGTEELLREPAPVIRKKMRDLKIGDKVLIIGRGVAEIRNLERNSSGKITATLFGQSRYSGYPQESFKLTLTPGKEVNVVAHNIREPDPSETKRAEKYAHDVANEMIKIRGFTSIKNAPREQTDAVFNLMAKYDQTFSRGFRSGVNPKIIARKIQYMEWDGEVEEPIAASITWGGEGPHYWHGKVMEPLTKAKYKEGQYIQVVSDLAKDYGKFLGMVGKVESVGLVQSNKGRRYVVVFRLDNRRLDRIHVYEKDMRLYQK